MTRLPEAEQPHFARSHSRVTFFRVRTYYYSTRYKVLP
jgi:hypothetical protein